jgi:hypothetical protein
MVGIGKLAVFDGESLGGSLAKKFYLREKIM